LLTRTTNYAIRAVAYMATLDPEEWADSIQVSRATGIPRRFLLKILRTLRARGFLVSTRGIGGGYRLAKPAAKISLLQIAEVFEDISRLEACPFGLARCRKAQPCPLHRRWESVQSALMSLLRETHFGRLGKMDFTGRWKRKPVRR